MAGPGGATGPAVPATATSEIVAGQDEVKPGAEQLAAGGSEVSQ